MYVAASSSEYVSAETPPLRGRAPIVGTGDRSSCRSSSDGDAADFSRTFDACSCGILGIVIKMSKSSSRERRKMLNNSTNLIQSDEVILEESDWIRGAAHTQLQQKQLLNGIVECIITTGVKDSREKCVSLLLVVNIRRSQINQE